MKRSCLIIITKILFRGNLDEYILDDQRVKILGYEIEEEIIAQPLKCGVVGVGESKANQILVNSLVSSEMNVVDSEIEAEDGEESVEETNGGHRGQKYEPEIQHDVNLLIDDIQRKNAQSIRLFNGS